MNYCYTDDQHALQETARHWFATRFTAQATEALFNDAAWIPESWLEFASLGWLGFTAPEKFGGSGVGLFEQAIISEEIGRSLYPGPWFSTVGLCDQLLDADTWPNVLSGRGSFTLAWAESAYDTLRPAPSGCQALATNGSWFLSGTKQFVTDLPWVSDAFVVAQCEDETGIFRIDLAAPSVLVQDQPAIDRSRPMGRLTMSNTPATLVLRGQTATEAMRVAGTRTNLLLAAEALGVGSACLNLAVAHARLRTSFGRPIGANQAISHPLADDAAALELARSLVWAAAWNIDSNEEFGDALAQAAKSQACSTAIRCAQNCIQVFGAMGFTWEHPAHRYLRRALSLEALNVGHQMTSGRYEPAG